MILWAVPVDSYDSAQFFDVSVFQYTVQFVPKWYKNIIRCYSWSRQYARHTKTTRYSSRNVNKYRITYLNTDWVMFFPNIWSHFLIPMNATQVLRLFGHVLSAIAPTSMTISMYTMSYSDQLWINFRKTSLTSYQ